MKEKTWVKPVLSMLCIIVIGFVLFNAAFLLAALVIKAVSSPATGIPPVYGRVIFVVLIYVISWFVFRSKLNDLAKATYLTMPLMVTLIVIGIFTFQMAVWVVYVLGAIVVAAVVYFIRREKLSWLYYFATAYVVVVALIVMLTGVEI